MQYFSQSGPQIPHISIIWHLLQRTILLSEGGSEVCICDQVPGRPLCSQTEQRSQKDVSMGFQVNRAGSEPLLFGLQNALNIPFLITAIP